MWSRENAYQLLFNFVASVATIFVNKLVFESFKFRFTTALTAMHYVVTLLGLEMLAAAGMYVKRSSPMTPRILLLSAVVGTAPALNNLSLSLNNLGFYQIVKLLVTPAIVGLEALLYGEKMSWPRAASLLLVCVGVGFACVNDLRLNWGGCVAALLWLPVAAVYKVLWSHVSKEESWHTLALMRRVLPLSTLFLMALVPVIDPPGFVIDPPGFVMDPPGFVSFEWSSYRVAMITLSGVAAFFVNWSGFLVMGACSALTHTVLGQLKGCVIIIGGWLLFSQVYPPKALLGAAIAIGASVAYTHYNLAEQQPKKSEPTEISPKRPLEDEDDSASSAQETPLMARG